jgi:hypothetical protein
MELTLEQTSMVDNARRLLRASTDEILLAALARTIANTVGDGVVAVDLAVDLVHHRQLWPQEGLRGWT